MKLFTSALFVCAFLAIKTIAQVPSPTPVPEDDGDIVKITTNLIQVDVTVLDKKGNQVTDLRPEDFEIRENGKVREISNFSYVAITREAKAEAEKTRAGVNEKTDRVPPAPVKLRPEQVRRTIVLVVDDLGLSLGSMFWVRQGLRKFVNEQMQPDDLVAILRTGSGVGALQQFTSDKRLLNAAIDKIKWNIISRGGMWTFEPIRPTTKDLINGVTDASGNTTNVPGNDRDKENEKNTEDFRKETYTLGSLGTLRYIIGGLNQMPGRKRVIFFSDGIKMDPRMEDQIKRIVDRANRAGVTIDTIDARGLTNASFLGPENDTRGMTMEGIEAAENTRRSDFIKAQDGLDYLAHETGGRLVKNTNSMSSAISQIMKTESGYYLIAYEPPGDTFDPKLSRYNTLEVKVKRPDLTVRYRSGFFGITDKDMKMGSDSLRDRLATALTSPFGSKDIETRLTSIFANDKAAGSYSRALLHIDTRAITFADDPSGNKKISLDIYAYVFGADGNVLNQLSKNYTFLVRPDSIARLNESGIIFPMNVPVAKPGAYQLRLAVRDAVSGKIGSASQFIDVPDLKKERLTLSGIVVQNITASELKAPRGDNGNAKALQDTATRTFKRGTVLIYNYAIYNAKTVSSGGTALQTYARLFRDGKLVFESTPQPVNTAGQTDLTHIEDRGILTLGSDLAPGDYVLQVVTTDSQAKEKNQIAAQSIDFEVVE